MISISDAGYDVLQPPGQLVVFIWAANEWRPAARLKVDLEVEGRPTYTLHYGRRWLRSDVRQPIDPIHLPLLEHDFRSDRVLFGAIRDALPDRWGCRLLQEHFEVLHAAAADNVVTAGRPRPRRRIPSFFDMLLLAGDDRVGALAFGFTPSAPVLRPASVAIKDLADLEAAMVRFDAGEAIDDALRLLAAGTSLGGARPKATVRREDGTLWMAKFRRAHSDVANVERVEHASMTLAAAAGIHVAETELVRLGFDRDVLLVRRFDRTQTGGRIPYLSAMTLTDYADTDEGGSYPEIADALRLAACGGTSDDLVELFRRMVFNVLIGNVDDHLKNHGVVNVSGTWRLSPAFDVLPTMDGGDLHAIGIGRFGRIPSFANILSHCGRFGLREDDARAIVEQVSTAVAGWKDHFAYCGVSASDIRLIERRMMPFEIDPGSSPGP